MPEASSLVAWVSDQGIGSFKISFFSLIVLAVEE